MIRKKGGTFYSVAPMITELVRAIRLDEKRVIPVSRRLQDGSNLGMKDVCVSLADNRRQGWTRAGAASRSCQTASGRRSSQSAGILRQAIEEVGL